MLGLVFGESADRALVLVCLLSHALLVFGTYRLGAAVFGRWSGALAALFVAASASFLLYAARGYVDSPFLALVVWAAVLEASDRAAPPLGAARARRACCGPRRGCSTGSRLVCGRCGRAEPRALASPLAPPSCSSRRSSGRLTDLVVTGDPLHSLHATSELADDLGRVRGRRSTSRARSCRSSAPPCARRWRVLAPIGVVLAWRMLGWRALRVPLALFAAGVITFVGTGVLGLSILPRYLTVPAVALCLFAGYALLGFTTLAAEHRWRRRWAQGVRGRRACSARSGWRSSRRR